MMLAATASLITHTLDERHSVSSATTMWLTAMYPVVIDPPINAEVALVLFRGGSLVTLHCTYQARTGPGDLPVRKTLSLLIFGRSEDQWEQVGSWVAGGADNMVVTGVGSFPPSDVGRVEVRWGSTALLEYRT
jgi:hypothetical protein